MAMYKIKYEDEDYYDSGESRWVTIYQSKTPLTTEKIIEVCKKYIIKQIKDWGDEEYLSTLKIKVTHEEKNEEGNLEIWIHVTTEGHGLSDYDYVAGFVYTEPVKEEDKEGYLF